MTARANPPTVVRVQRRAPQLPRCACGNSPVQRRGLGVKLRPKGAVEITASGAAYACYFCGRAVEVPTSLLLGVLDGGS